MPLDHPMDKKDNIFTTESIKNSLSRNYPWISFVLFSLILFLVYFPVFFKEFGIHNDYYYFFYNKSKNWMDYPESSHLILIGRPVGALLLNIQGLFINSISDLALARFISFLFILASSYLVYSYLYNRLSLNSVWALLLTFCVFTLPSSQLFVIWSTNFVPGSLNVFLVIVSYFIYDKIKIRDPLKRHANNVYLITAFCIFLASLFIYPPTSTFFLVFTLATLLFSDFSSWEMTRFRVVQDIVFCLSAMISYFIVNKLLFLPLFSTFGWQKIESATYEFGLSTDFAGIPDQFISFSKLAISGVLHPLYGDTFFPLIVSILAGLAVSALIGYWISMWRKNNKIKKISKISFLLQFCAMGSFLVILSVSPMLFSYGGGLVAYRTLFPYSAMVVLTLFFLIILLSRFGSKQRLLACTFAILIATSSAVIATTNLQNTAENANLELNYIRQQFVSADFTHVDNIYFITYDSSLTRSLTDRKLNLDFALTATGNYSAFIPGIATITLSEIGINPATICVYYDYLPSFGHKKVIFITNSTLVVNMNDAKKSISVGQVNTHPDIPLLPLGGEWKLQTYDCTNFIFDCPNRIKTETCTGHIDSLLWQQLSLYQNFLHMKNNLTRGWYGLESKWEGVVWRWTGANNEDPTIKFFVQNETNNVDFLLNYSAADANNNFSVFLDNRKIADCNASSTNVTYSCVFGDISASKGEHDLVIKSQKPARVHGTADLRTLGYAFTDIRIVVKNREIK